MAKLTRVTDWLVKFKSKLVGSVERLLDDKLTDIVDAKDFGAAGDGVNADTSAFLNLENAIQGTVIDLKGRTYLVSKTFYKNTYINGFWLVNGKKIPTNGSLITNKKPAWDVHVVGRETDSAIRFIPIAQGRGSIRTLQTFVYDPVGRAYYSNHNTEIDGNPTTVSVWNKYSSEAPIKSPSVDFMLPEDRLGHQGIAVQNKNGVMKLWTTAPGEPAGETTHPNFDFTVGGSHGVVRFDWRTNTAGEINNPEVFRLVEEGRVAGSSTTPTISLDGKWMIVRFTDGGDYNNQTFRIFDMNIFTDAGDYSSMCTHEFTLNLQSVGGSETTSLSGFCSDGSHLYMYCGNTTFGATQYLSSCDLLGNDVRKAISTLGDTDLPRIIGSSPTFRESEGMHFVEYDGVIYPSVNLVSEHSDIMGGSRRTVLVYALGAGGKRNLASPTKSLLLYDNPEMSPHVIDVGVDSKNDSIKTVRVNNDQGTGHLYEWQRKGTTYFKMYMSTSNVALMADNGADLLLGSFDSWRWKISEPGNFHPYIDNEYNLGVPDQRIKQIFCANDVINTCDARLKSGIRDITQQEVSAFISILKLPSVWQWLHKMDTSDGRIHSFPTVQAAIQIMTDNGLDWTRYSAFCYNSWEDEYDKETGELVRPKGDIYAFRKSELLWWCVRALMSKVDSFEERLSKLEVGSAAD